MSKRKRNTVIAIAAIFLILITSCAAVVNHFGFDSLVAMLTPPPASEPEGSGDKGITLANLLNGTYDWNTSEFEISRQGLSIQIKGIELSKEMSDLNLPALQHFGKYSEAQFDASGNILNDYTYFKVSITVQNLYDKKAHCYLNSVLSYGTLEELKGEGLTWPNFGDDPVSMTGDNEQNDPNAFFIRNFEPGEMREFTLGFVIKETDLNKENKFLYRIEPTMMSFGPYREDPAAPIDSEYSSIVTEATDNQLRYLYLNPYIEEELK